VILAGDIGGTNTRLAFFGEDLVQPLAEQTVPSRAHAGLAEIVRAFVAERRLEPQLACFGVAGPVRDDRCEATNLPWVVDRRELASCLGSERVWLINDLEANAFGLASLGESDFCTLQEGAPGARGNLCVVSAGTGLGEAGVLWDGDAHHPFATEGGHASFSAESDLEIDLLRWLRRRFDEHVSWERVVSGPGLVNLYHFLRDSGRGEEPAWLADEIAAGDPAAVVSLHAQDGRSELCAQALDLFAHFYGAEAGNAALKYLAIGGVYLGGGIAPRNLAKMKDGTFLRSFLDKGRMRDVLEAMPVRVVLNPKAALLGSARCAALRGGAR